LGFEPRWKTLQVRLVRPAIDAARLTPDEYRSALQFILDSWVRLMAAPQRVRISYLGSGLPYTAMEIAELVEVGRKVMAERKLELQDHAGAGLIAGPGAREVLVELFGARLGDA